MRPPTRDLRRETRRIEEAETRPEVYFPPPGLPSPSHFNQPPHSPNSSIPNGQFSRFEPSTRDDEHRVGAKQSGVQRELGEGTRRGRYTFEPEGGEMHVEPSEFRPVFDSETTFSPNNTPITQSNSISSSYTPSQVPNVSGATDEAQAINRSFLSPSQMLPPLREAIWTPDHANQQRERTETIFPPPTTTTHVHSDPRSPFPLMSDYLSGEEGPRYSPSSQPFHHFQYAPSENDEISSTTTESPSSTPVELGEPAEVCDKTVQTDGAGMNAPSTIALPTTEESWTVVENVRVTLHPTAVQLRPSEPIDLNMFIHITHDFIRPSNPSIHTAPPTVQVQCNVTTETESQSESTHSTGEMQSGETSGSPHFDYSSSSAPNSSHFYDNSESLAARIQDRLHEVFGNTSENDADNEMSEHGPSHPAPAFSVESFREDSPIHVPVDLVPDQESILANYHKDLERQIARQLACLDQSFVSPDGTISEHALYKENFFTQVLERIRSLCLDTTNAKEASQYTLWYEYVLDQQACHEILHRYLEAGEVPVLHDKPMKEHAQWVPKKVLAYLQSPTEFHFPSSVEGEVIRKEVVQPWPSPPLSIAAASELQNSEIQVTTVPTQKGKEVARPSFDPLSPPSSVQHKTPRSTSAAMDSQMNQKHLSHLNMLMRTNLHRFQMHQLSKPHFYLTTQLLRQSRRPWNSQMM
ncbi:hypothetical protein ONZ45_g19643 [Pleurotus djamor]|nr:hypothetical protein ONZ45_g19643 [Pleurotus djamor]